MMVSRNPLTISFSFSKTSSAFGPQAPNVKTTSIGCSEKQKQKILVKQKTKKYPKLKLNTVIYLCHFVAQYLSHFTLSFWKQKLYNYLIELIQTVWIYYKNLRQIFPQTDFNLRLISNRSNIKKSLLFDTVMYCTLFISSHLCRQNFIHCTNWLSKSIRCLKKNYLYNYFNIFSYRTVLLAYLVFLYTGSTIVFNLKSCMSCIMFATAVDNTWKTPQGFHKPTHPTFGFPWYIKDYN